MVVTMGISHPDYAREKFSITLDETDLERICVQYGLFKRDELTTDQAMLLLTTEAERFVLVQAPKYGRDIEVVREQLRQNRECMSTVLTAITALTLDETRKTVGLA